jgi:glutamate N-acetyltransferase/amino-acid N-acetyltransferase
VSADQVLVMSTGIIGHPLPMPNIARGIMQAAADLRANEEGFLAAARGILTTDRGTKVATRSLRSGDRPIAIAGMAKGAGMIGPNMATMLAIITTDARLDASSADTMLRRVANQSFNCISVEGHTSTNDALMLIASGGSAAKPLVGDALEQFESELTQMAVELATQIPADGEGATHLISVAVDGAVNHSDADRIGRSIANSPLVKCAITGGDPNWGRIVSAAGYCGVALTPQEITLRINRHEVFRNGAPTDFNATTVSESITSNFETKIELTVGTGSGVAQHWTSDLTVAYVRFNSEYTT